MANALLNFARLLFGFAFGFQIAILRNLPDLLFDCPLHVVEAALDPIFRAGFHIFLLVPRVARTAAFVSVFEGISLL
jgi:hypothetical protein